MREAVIDIVSGSVAGMVSTAVGHPFDTLKDLDLTKYRFGYKKIGFGNFCGNIPNYSKRRIMRKTRMQIYPGRYGNSIRFGLMSAAV